MEVEFNPYKLAVLSPDAGLCKHYVGRFRVKATSKEDVYHGKEYDGFLSDYSDRLFLYSPKGSENYVRVFNAKDLERVD